MPGVRTGEGGWHRSLYCFDSDRRWLIAQRQTGRVLYGSNSLHTEGQVLSCCNPLMDYSSQLESIDDKLGRIIDCLCDLTALLSEQRTEPVITEQLMCDRCTQVQTFRSCGGGWLKCTKCASEIPVTGRPTSTPGQARGQDASPEMASPAGNPPCPNCWTRTVKGIAMGEGHLVCTYDCPNCKQMLDAHGKILIAGDPSKSVYTPTNPSGPTRKKRL